MAQNPLGRLAGQTVVYGMGTIVPRLLNYLLVPFYTRFMLQDEYGVVTELYAYIAFFLVVLLYGMETTFFRFTSDKSGKPVYGTALISVFATSSLFFMGILMSFRPLAELLSYGSNPEYILMAAAIVAIDAVNAIQFAKLRQENRAFLFSLIKIIIVAVNILLNLYFIWFCEETYSVNPDSPLLIFYQPGQRVTYVLLSNLIASLLGVILLIPFSFKDRLVFDKGLWQRMFRYTFPLLVVGIAGMVNEVADKILYKYLVAIPPGVSDVEAYVLSELGIYGASYKLAVLMTLFIQMFRYAAEPFFFSHRGRQSSERIYADVMKYFILFGLIIFLGITLFIDVIKYFLGNDYWGALAVVPIILLSYLLQGIFYNLSVWYKLNDMTRFGAYIALGGAVVTIVTNVLLIPRFSYMGAAWSHLICYLFMVIVSYNLGRKYYRINYDLKNISIYVVLGLIIFFLFRLVKIYTTLSGVPVAVLLFLLFVGFVSYREIPYLRKLRYED
ncbi:MAG: oligosaccharide flippase family protein [Bacteroidales bacterium]